MSRLEKIKEQHPELNVTIIDLLARVDPTDSYKYLEFLVKTLKDYFQEENEELGLHIGIDLIGTENTKTLNEYEKHCKANRVEKNDITQIKTWQEMKSEVKKAEVIEEQKKNEKQIKKIFEDENYKLLIPLSYEACKIYGSNTKWCITQKSHWDTYSKSYNILFVIDKTSNKKYAISRKKGEKTIDAWDEKDVQMSPLLLKLPHEIMDKIVETILKEKTIVEMAKNLVKKEEPKQKKMDAYLPYLDPNNFTGAYYDENLIGELFSKWIDSSKIPTSYFYTKGDE